eukprot:5281726-Pleurochrysis_carterae.AAC.4
MSPPTRAQLNALPPQPLLEPTPSADLSRPPPLQKHTPNARGFTFPSARQRARRAPASGALAHSVSRRPPVPFRRTPRYSPILQRADPRQLERLADALAEEAAHGAADSTLKKDERAWLLWTQYAALI